MAMSGFQQVENDFRENGWIFDTPFRSLPLLNGDGTVVNIFPRDVAKCEPEMFTINFWQESEGRLDGLR